MVTFQTFDQSSKDIRHDVRCLIKGKGKEAIVFAIGDDSKKKKKNTKNFISLFHPPWT